jgi:dUTP pyrophosphatase
MQLRIKKTHPDAVLPTRAHTTDLGYDLYALEDVVLHREKATKVRTGISMGFPEGWGGILKDRSSLASKGILSSGGVIDSAYTGELTVMMIYMPQPSITDSQCLKMEYNIYKGNKIIQLIPTAVVHWDVVEVDELEATDRGSKGFGSSGL